MAAPDRGELVRTLAVAAGPALLLVAHAMLFDGYLVDDAYVSLSYARSLAEGHGLVFQAGAPPVEGYTNFAWVLLAAGAISAGLEPARALAVLGLACGVATVVLVVAAARRIDGDDGQGRPARFAGAAAGVLVAAHPGTAFYAVTGLETSLYALLTLGAALALVARRPIVFGALAGAAFLVRPEAALLALAGVAVFAAWPRAGAARVRPALLAGGAAAVLALPLLVLKLAWFGALLPNTAHAKAPSLVAGLSYASDALPGILFLAAAALFGLRRRFSRTSIELSWLAVVFGIVPILEGGDWMVAGRLFVPIVPWLAIAADGAVRSAVALRPPRLDPAIVLALLLPHLGIGALESTTLGDAVPYALHRREVRAELARRFVREGARSVALVDIGYVAWTAPELRIVDLAGLTDRDIARAPGEHLDARISEELLAARAPDRVVLTSSTASELRSSETGGPFAFGVERRVAGSRWLRAHCRDAGVVVADETYRMHVFERER